MGQKLVSGFAAITLVLLALVGGLFVSVHRLGDAHQQLAGPASMLSQSADRVRYAAGELRAAQQAYVLDSGESRGSFSDASRRFEVALAVLRSSVIDSVDAALVDKIAAGYQTFVVTDEMAWEALQAHDVVLARNLTLGPEGLAFGFMTDDASKLTERASEQRMGASAEFANASRDAQLLGLTMAAVAIVFVVAASRVITRLIRDPLQRVQQVAELAAGGDLNAHVVVSSDDETGRLGRSFNTMLERLRNREHALRVDHRRQELAGQIHRAFEIADDEDAALDVVGRAMATITDDRPAELLLADNSKAHLHRAVVSGSDPHGPGDSRGSRCHRDVQIRPLPLSQPRP